MIERVISGGQTGADRAGWRAAQEFRIATGGWMPRGFLAEDGRHPGFARQFGAKETASDGYPERTRRNAQEADVTLWFGDPTSRGAILTFAHCRGPHIAIHPPIARYDWAVDDVAAWLDDPRNGFRVLNVAGNRASKNPEIGGFAEDYLVAVFARILAVRAEEAS